MKRATMVLLLTFTAVFAQETGTFKDSRDGREYKTVKIGKQTWMAENLNYNAKGSVCYGEGGKVVTAFGEDRKPSKTETLPNAEVQSNCSKYGRLYNWATAKTACPAGWHLSSFEEWGDLVESVGGIYAADEALKAKSGWDAGNGTDAYGFSALPGGRRVNNLFFEVKRTSLFWTATETSSKEANFHGFLMENYSKPHRAVKNAPGYWNPPADKNSLYSARCIKDEAPSPAPAPTQSSFTDSRDKKSYKSVKIGEQVWMAENLNYNAKGSKCGNESTEKLTEKDADCKKYGRLYSWPTAMNIDEKFDKEKWGGGDKNHQGVCPPGWHLPDTAEWKTLINSAGDNVAKWDDEKSIVAGKKLKAKSGWNRYQNKSSDGTDEFGFSALPGGSGNLDGSFYNAGDYGYWYTSSEFDQESAHLTFMVRGGENVNLNIIRKRSLNSVRCVQGEGTTPAPATTPTPAPAPTPTPTPSPAPTPTPANNASTPMYCVVYMGGKLTTCTEMKDTKENKATCDTQNKGLKMVRGEAKWTSVKPNVNCGK